MNCDTVLQKVTAAVPANRRYLKRDMALRPWGNEAGARRACTDRAIR